MNKERHQKLAKALDSIRTTLIHHYQPEKIILFGSMADDNISEWSDLDLAVIKDTAKPFYQRLREVALLCLPLVSVDFLVYTPAEFSQMIADKNPFIVEEIVNKGKVIYERESTKTCQTNTSFCNTQTAHVSENSFTSAEGPDTTPAVRDAPPPLPKNLAAAQDQKYPPHSPATDASLVLG